MSITIIINGSSILHALLLTHTSLLLIVRNDKEKMEKTKKKEQEE